MIVRETEEDYTVYGVQAEQKGDQYVLKWKFRQADGFVIALSRFGKMEDIPAAFGGISKEKEDELQEEKYLEHGGYRFWFVTKEDFLVNDRKYGIQKRLLFPGVPCVISVYPCRKRDDGMELIRLEKENTVFFPLPVDIRLSYSKKWPWSGKRQCTLHIRRPEGYQDGALLYRAGNSRFSIPLTAECLDRDLMIYISPEEEIEVKVAEAWKGSYRIRKN